MSKVYEKGYQPQQRASSSIPDRLLEEAIKELGEKTAQQQAQVTPAPSVAQGTRSKVLISHDLQTDRQNVWQEFKKHALAKDIFLYGDIPVTIGIDIYGSLRTTPLDLYTFKNMLVDAIQFTVKKKSSVVDCYPSDVLVRQLLAEIATADFEELRGLSETPYPRLDGTIVTTPGYDSTSKIYFQQTHGLKDVKVSNVPTEAEIAAARDLLLDLVHDFLFVVEYELVKQEDGTEQVIEHHYDRANALGLLVELVLRLCITGDKLAYGADGSQSGVGKGLWLKVASILAFGTSPEITSFPTSEDEVRKDSYTRLLNSQAFIIFDNKRCTTGIDSEFMEGLITCDGLTSNRILHTNTLKRVRNNSIFAFTGNQLQFGGDMPRRVVKFRILAEKEENDKRTGFLHDPLEDYVKEKRAALLGAVLTLYRAWVIAGSPDAEVELSSSFKQCAHIVGGVLHYAGIDGFYGNREKTVVESDDRRMSQNQFLHLWLKKWPSKDTQTGSIATTSEPMTAREFTNELDDSQTYLTFADVLPRNFIKAFKSKLKDEAPRLLGAFFRSFRDEKFAQNYRLEAHQVKGHPAKWYVKRNDPTDEEKQVHEKKRQAFIDGATHDVKESSIDEDPSQATLEATRYSQATFQTNTIVEEQNYLEESDYDHGNIQE
jgi:hypothetical protein